MNEVVREFLLETHENLAQLDLDLVTLEKDPTERETLARAFRTLHTVKGTAGFLGLLKLQAVAHSAENVLSRLRAGEMPFNLTVASALLAAVDATRHLLADIERTEREGEQDYGAVVRALEQLTDPGTAAAAEPAPAARPGLRPVPPTHAPAPRPAVTMVQPAA